jgi:hypothetical protein
MSVGRIFFGGARLVVAALRLYIESTSTYQPPFVTPINHVRVFPAEYHYPCFYCFEADDEAIDTA